ncbi:MAG: hypothetical protein M3Z66_00520 [Chloroflexota bacterium]|nr:hypothetical protein [Chloroflexota bacterium]
MRGQVLVVPHGTGIGDAVTARPFLEAIVKHEDRGQVFVLLPAHLAWLLPPGAAPATQQLLSRLWQRMGPDSRTAVLLRRLSARQTARLAHPAVIRAAALGLTSLLEFEGYEVINLLEYFSQLDLHRRWTAGSWSRDRRHVIDLLADRLQERGITVPAQRRAPTIRLDPLPLDGAPAVILNPNAGSTLKEPPAGFWVGVVAALRRSSIRPFVLAAPGRGMARDIVQEAPGSILLEETELPRVAARLAGADLVISPDSGILHLAAATGTRFLGLFGPTDPLFLGPNRQDGGVLLQTAVRHGEVCRGCWTAQLLPAARCAFLDAHNCLAGIHPEAVVDTALALLREPVGEQGQVTIHDLLEFHCEPLSLDG